MAGGRIWTQEEIEFLEENVGFMTAATMAKRLDRGVRATVGKMEKLGIGNTKLLSGKLTANELARSLNIDSHAVYRWIEHKGLTAQLKSTRGSGKFHFIDVNNFWKWAEKNRDLINFSKIDRYELAPQPAWVEDQRKEDDKHIPKKASTRWSAEETNRLIILCKQGSSVPQLAKRFNRTEKAIDRKISRLRTQRKLPYKKVVLRWSEEEVQIMIKLEALGKTDVEIAEELGREDVHVADKRRRLRKEPWYVGKVQRKEA